LVRLEHILAVPRHCPQVDLRVGGVEVPRRHPASIGRETRTWTDDDAPTPDAPEITAVVCYRRILGR